MPKLTALAVAKARPGKMRREIHDTGCPGLFLVVQPTGHRSWAVRYRFRGLSRKLTLGAVLTGEEPSEIPQLDTPLSLMAARQLATAALRQAKSGTDPTVEKRQKRNAERAAEANTLRAEADRYLKLVQREQPMRTIDQRKSDLDLICKMGRLGDLELDTVSKEQFTKQLDNISMERGPVRANRVQMAVKRLLTWYADRRTGYINVLANVRARVSIKERARKRVLSAEELRRVWLAAETFPPPFGPFLRFVLLTAARRNEAGGLRRSELHDDGATWVLPWVRSKSGAKSKTDFLIPLSKAAQAIIAAQPPGEFVFPSAGGRRPLGNFDRFKKAFDEACGVSDWTIHDLRRSTRTILSRITTPDTAERCLGHALDGIRGTYDMHDYEPEKRHAFKALATEIEHIVRPPPKDKVTDLTIERSRRRR